MGIRGWCGIVTKCDKGCGKSEQGQGVVKLLATAKAMLCHLFWSVASRMRTGFKTAKFSRKRDLDSRLDSSDVGNGIFRRM